MPALLLTLASVAQDDSYSFDNYSNRDGLSQATINCILQDSEGFMWFGTQAGINKFDGYSFSSIQYNAKGKISLTDNWVLCMAEDKEGNIWVGTKNGLNMVSKDRKEVKQYKHDPYDLSSLNDVSVYGIYVDSDNVVWVKTFSALNKLNKKTGKFNFFEQRIDRFNNNKDPDRKFPIIQDNEGYLWIGSTEGVNRFHKSFEEYTLRLRNDEDNPQSLSDNNVTALMQDDEGFLWIGTKNGLNKFNIKTNQIEKKYFHNPFDSYSLSDNDIFEIIQDYNGNIWVGTASGLNKFDKKTERFHSFFHNSANRESISNNTIRALFEDNSNNLWIGTDAKGIDKTNLKRKKFITYRPSSGKHAVDLSYEIIASIYKPNSDTIWIGTWGKGLDVFNRKTHEVTHYREELSGKSKIANNFVHVIYKDSKSRIWLGTRNGINLYNTKNNSFDDLKDYFTGKYYPNFNSNRIYSIKEDFKNNIWVASYSGLHKINLDSMEIVSKYANINDSSTLSVNKIYSLCVDRDGVLWVGTFTGGLNMYNSGTDKFRQFKNNPKSENSISHNTIFCLAEDREGYLWIGTDGGLNKYDKNKDVFTRYTKEDGLPDATIYQIQIDFHDNIWVSTRRGIAVLNKETGKIRSFEPDDGLQDYEFNNGASHFSFDGELFFGGTNGLNAFYPDSLVDNNFIPKMIFTSFIKNRTTGNEEFSISNGEKIVLNHKENMFTIEFSALEFTKPERNQYKYMMVGLEDEWIDIGTQHKVTFTNIPTGEYTFKLIASNNDGVWNTEPIELKIVIEPPFWRTNIAYILYVVFVGLLFYLFIEFRTKSLKKANHILREKQLAALEIAKQKEELTVKNKNITDSINYAKRIQQAMMPSKYLFRKLLPEFFILYKPKDIVSGDFYWITEKRNKIYIAAVDCTGHGVPGAFMSIIGFDLLRNITVDQGVDDPAEILNRLNIGVSETFSKNTEDDTVKDGMDIALLVIDKNEKMIEFSGAFNPLFLVRNNDIIEIRSNRFSVGMVSDEDESRIFESHSMPYQENDVLYIFTDGYPDQFGGPLGKKFKYRRFRHLLLTIHGMPMKKQRDFLDENIENWRGELEQVDDVLVIGIKITS